jgi:hypothetical protein
LRRLNHHGVLRIYCLALALLAVGIADGSVAARISGISACTLSTNGDATINGSTLTLTTNDFQQAGSSFFTTPQNVSGGFVASFRFTASGNREADGITFSVQNAPGGTAAIGSWGNGLGSAPNSQSVTASISQCCAVAFNIIAPGTAVTTNGIRPSSYQGTGTVNPTASTLTELLTQGLNTYSRTFTGVNIPANLNNTANPGFGYIGFTGATGFLRFTLEVSNFTSSRRGRILRFRQSRAQQCRPDGASWLHLSIGSPRLIQCPCNMSIINVLCLLLCILSAHTHLLHVTIYTVPYFIYRDTLLGISALLL